MARAEEAAPSRWRHRLIAVLSIPLCTATGCRHDAEPPSREKELQFLQVLVPEPLLPHARLEVPGLENIQQGQEGTEHHLNLHLFPGQAKLNKGIRAEVTLDLPHREGETLRYEWRFRLPPDFQSDAPQNRWWIIGQWHDQPDPTKGETWEGFPSRSPPLLIGLGEIGGRMALGIEYGPTQAQKHGPLYIDRGVWHHIAFIIHWSQNDDGSAQVFLDDMQQPVVTFRGRNMHNGYQHFLKLGMYRHPGIEKASCIQLSRLNIIRIPPPGTPGQRSSEK